MPPETSREDTSPLKAPPEPEPSDSAPESPPEPEEGRRLSEILSALTLFVCAAASAALAAFVWLVPADDADALLPSPAPEGDVGVHLESLPPPKNEQGTPSVIRLAMIEFNSTVTEANQINRTLEVVRKALAPAVVSFEVCSAAELERRVKAAEVDFFVASSGFYWRTIAYGVRSLATRTSALTPDPNHSAGIAFVVPREAPWQTIGDLAGKRLSSSYPTAFYGYRIGMAEIAFAGFEPETFFSSTVFAGRPNLPQIMKALDKGLADVAFLHACGYEAMPGDMQRRYRVLEANTDNPTGCAISTRTYPGHTFAVMRGVNPELARTVASALLSMSSDEEGAERWSIATDFTAVDALYKVLKTGPYAYLKETSFRQWVERHLTYLFAGLVLVAGLAAHSLRADQLVRQKTRELTAAARQKALARQQIEAMNARLERTQKANIVGLLSSMITHELAQPLAAIRHYAEAQRVLLSAPSINAKLLATSAGRINEQCERAIAIVEKVRGYAKGSSRKETRVDLAQTIGKLARALKISEEGLTLDLDVPTPCVAAGDALEFELLFWNLLKNARDACRGMPGARIAVRAKLDRTLEAPVWRIHIVNSGKMLDEADISALLVPLQSSKPGGLGLGISICTSIAEASGGHVAFRAAAQGGLDVEVALPAA